MKNLISRCIFFIGSFILAFSARAELTIEITKTVSEPYPIAIVPFEWTGAEAIPQDIAQIVSADLQRSGQFDTLPKEDMLSTPHRKTEIFFRDWRILKQDYLLVGSIQKEPAGDYAVSFELYDVVRERPIAERRITTKAGGLRDIAHYISDYVYKEIIGKDSAFSTKLVYVTSDRRKTKFELRVSDVDGYRERVILNSKQPIISPAWSPDAKKIAYVSFESGRSAVYVQDLATGQRKVIAKYKGSNSAPAWSPDGTKLALVLSKDGNPEVYVKNLSTDRLSRLTNHYGIDTEPNWMPDGRSLVFTSSRGGKPQIYQVDVATKAVKRLTFEGNYNARGRVSKDGKFLVMVHRNDKRFHIAAQELKTGDIRILTNDTKLDESPSLAPNSNELIYATKVNGKGILAAVSIDGQVEYRLPATYGEVREPAWSPFLH